MKLYFLRHASAADIAPSDAARALTAQGEAEASLAGTALAKLGVQPVQVLSSPLLRAQQTAKIAAAALNRPVGVTLLDELCNGTATAALLEALQPWAAAPEILLVGHMPSVAEHVSVLLGRPAASDLTFGKAGAACVELANLRAGAGKLLWLMQQPELARLAG
jgi:phosphohistidine phosphatase